jgi:hypothetical protein
MDVDATEGEALSGLFQGEFEGIVGRASIVTMVVLDGDAMLLGKLLKGKLGCEGFFGRQGHHWMDVLQVQEVVDTYCCCLVSLLLEHVLELGDKKPHLGGDHLVDGDALTRSCCNEDLVAVGGLLSHPVDLVDCSKGMH